MTSATPSHDPEDVRIGRAAMARGLVTAEQVREALADQAQLAAVGTHLRLHHVLLRRGWISVEAASSLAVPPTTHAAISPPPPARTPSGPVAPVHAPSGRLPATKAALTPAPGSNSAAGRMAAAPVLLPGTLIGPYRLVEEIGRGGMGIIFKATDQKSGEAVALKILRDPGRAVLIERFVRETKAVGRLDHPGIVKLIDSGKVGDLPYYSMELVTGRPLDVRLAKDGKMDRRRAAALVRDIARAVHSAHEAGVIHRDLKPANVLVTEDGAPKITDFGLAKIEDEDRKLTRTGAAIGTPHYMSPEQIRGEAVDRRTDVFALGVILYEILAGEPPWTGETPAEVFGKIAQTPLPALGDASPLEAVVKKACQKYPADRYSTAEALAKDLDAWLAGQEVRGTAGPSPLTRLGREARARSQLLAGALVAAMLLVPLAVFLALRKGPIEIRTETREVAKVESQSQAPTTPESRARAQLALVTTWRRAHPEDLRGAMERYQAIVSDFPGTDSAALAKDAADSLLALITASEREAWDELVKKIQVDLRSDDVATAIWRLEPVSTDPAWSAEAKKKAQTLQREIETRTRSTLADAEKQGTELADSNPAEAEKAFSVLHGFKLPPSIEPDRTERERRLSAAIAAGWRKQQAAKASDAERAKAAAELAEARKLVDDALAFEKTGDLEAARARLGTANLVSSVVAARLEVTQLMAGRDALRAALAGLDVELGAGIEGKVEKLDEARLVLVLKPRKKGGPTEGPLSKLQAAKLSKLSPAEKAAAANYLLLRGEGELGLELAASAGDAGKPLLERARAAAAAERHQEAAAALDAAIAAANAAKNPAEAATRLRAAVEKNKADPAFAERKAAIKDAYTKARTLELKEDPSLLFHGAKAKVEKGVLAVTYEWKDAAAARDWICDSATPGSTLKIDAKNGRAAIEGHVRHFARLTGKVSVRAVLSGVDPAAPNANLLLHDQGGLAGCMVAVGWKPKDLAKVAVPKDAQPRPGSTIALPALAVVLPVAGKAASEWRIEYAESGGDDLAAPGQRLRLEVTKEDKLLRVKANGASIIELAPAPMPKQLGGVGFVPEASGLVLHEVHIEGKLDPDFIATAGAAQATAEAEELVR